MLFIKKNKNKNKNKNKIIRKERKSVKGEIMKKEELKEYVKENWDLNSIVQDINSWDGSLEHLYFYENEEDFFKMFYENDVLGAVRAVCYGEYNYMDEYVRINAYGNLESCSKYEIDSILEDSFDEIFDRLLDTYQELSWLDDELIQNIEEYLNSDEEEE